MLSRILPTVLAVLLLSPVDASAQSTAPTDSTAVAPAPVAVPPPMPAPVAPSAVTAIDLLDPRHQQDLPLRQAFLPSLRTLGPDEGLVRFAVVTNDLRARQPDVVTVVDHHTQYEIRPVSDGLSVNTGLYVAVLPAGRYTVRRFDDRQTFRWIAFNGYSQRALGDFEVKAGAAADLGTLLLVPVDSDAYQLGRLDYRAPEADWRAAAPQSMERWASLPPDGGWRGAPWPISKAAAERPPVGIQQVRELPDGTLLVPTAMGRLRIRSPQGEWRELAGPRPTPFNWATPGAVAGEYLALGESRRVVLFAADGTPREIALQGLPEGRLIHAAFGTDGYWYLAQERHLAVKLLRARTLEAAQWEEVGSVNLTASVWSGNRGAFVTDTADGILLVQSSTGLLRYYSYATGTFTNRHLDDNRDILAVDVMPDGTVSVLTIAAGGFAGVFSGAWVSADRGATWREISTGYKVKVTPLVLPGDGRILQAGGVFGDSGIKVSLDDGKTWSQLTEALPVESRLIATRTLGLLAVRRMGVQDILLRSTDGGRTWAHEWSSLPQAAVERVLKAEADERAARDAKRAAAKRQR